jgi:hypothetical protein
MIFEKSLKQLLRTPVTAALFLALFATSAFFLCCGVNIWVQNGATIKAYEDAFLTIGVVQQSATAVATGEQWNAEIKQYSYFNYPRYSSIVPASALDFEGVNYLLGPEKRPYYGAWSQDYKTYDNLSNFLLAELTPLTDCVPDAPVKMKVVKVLSSGYTYNEGDTLWLCDLFNDNPQPLYAGKTYVMSLQEYSSNTTNLDYIPASGIVSTQYRADGTSVQADFNTSFYQEVTAGFYQTEDGKRWQELAKTRQRMNETIPVWPTSGTHLLLPFYNGTAFILEGEDISAEEYANGERVCLIPQNFARGNGLAVGDMLRLPLYYANYQNAPIDTFNTIGIRFSFSLLNAKGKLYPIFSDHEYLIKGIYQSIEGSGSRQGMGKNTVVIPSSSVRESDADNILDYGPMQNTTTSFQIPNGTIESFMTLWAQQKNDQLKITFYDRGYTQLQRGLENMKKMSVLFLAVGATMSLTLVLFFCHIFITRQKMRSAIERMLGFSKRKSAVSLLSGFLLAAVLAIAIGCTAGYFAGTLLSQNTSMGMYYNTDFTSGHVAEEPPDVDEQTLPVWYSAAVGAILFVTTCLVSVVFIHDNLKEEPLKMLSSKKE